MYERTEWNAGLNKLITEEEYTRLSPANKLYYRKREEAVQDNTGPYGPAPIDPKPFVSLTNEANNAESGYSSGFDVPENYNP